jgi:hypothetical protein
MDNKGKLGIWQPKLEGVSKEVKCYRDFILSGKV